MRAVIIATSLMVIASNSHAATVYEFVEGDTNEVLAYWALSQLPAAHTDVESLTFTPQGEAIFGLGSVYAGVFDNTAISLAYDDGMGGLGSDGDHIDFMVPMILHDWQTNHSTHAVEPLLSHLDLGYHNDPGQDMIRYRYNSLNTDIETPSITVIGDWRQTAVPEPSTVMLALLGFLTSTRRRT